ncbi:DUF2716 domain-containing protein [Streptomyces sp. NBC_00091]|uniref:DUF2716 domain-containing protein n=1 Tax=Streptomyces sp. NBC_00091 TaxID=2975648 RepID=UPI00224E4422|nr:DUF2716 domain-containing protein [Streptomyces sp. NBC_00091]MCX5380394.1 DUF2716 domain-containing protein [Streptomyces sp. NBC_00091]
MKNESVVPIPETEYRRVWDRFHAEFGFRPSVNPAQWPSIEEPVASATWSLASLDDDPGDEGLDRLVDAVRQGLTACVPPQGRLFALDWQHVSFQFSPHLAGKPGQKPWPLSPYPDGDYYIYLTEDFSTGSFGHPWEGTLCLFGQGLLDLVGAQVDEVLGAPIRRAGRPVHRQ